MGIGKHYCVDPDYFCRNCIVQIVSLTNPIKNRITQCNEFRSQLFDERKNRILD